MGEVFLATHLQLGRRVAIKFLRAQVLQNAELRERFRREAMAAATLVSDHIAQVFDVGELPGGAPFMVMEYLEGMDLSAWQQQRGLLSVVEAVGLLRQACAGLAVAHASRVVHRDLKPANLFLVPHASGPLLKILDFGVAKVPVASYYGTYIPPPSSGAGVVGWQVFPALNAVRAVAAVALGASEAAPQPAETGAPNRAPLEVKNLSRVEPLELLPTALEQARRLDPTVGLERFSVSGSFPADGALDMSGSSVVVFTFSTVSPKPWRVVVNVSAELGYFVLEDRLDHHPSSDPRAFGTPCSLARAMRAVVTQGGSPKARYSAYYGLQTPGKWAITELNARETVEHLFEVDGASCVARKDL